MRVDLRVDVSVLGMCVGIWLQYGGANIVICGIFCELLDARLLHNGVYL
jgi:hypothetical protein